MPTTPMSKYTAFRCPEDLLERAKLKASKDRRSLSNYLITLIEKDVGTGTPSNGNGHAPVARAVAKPEKEKKRKKT